MWHSKMALDNKLKANVAGTKVWMTTTEDAPTAMAGGTNTVKELLKRRYWKNIVVIGSCFAFYFSAYYPLDALQSSMNSGGGLGTVALSVKYGTMTVGAFFSAAIAAKLGTKWSMVVGLCLDSMFVVANFLPNWATLIPAAALSGMGGIINRTAQGIYMTRLCNEYVAFGFGDDADTKTRTTQEDKFNKVKVKAFGVFNVLYFSSFAIGNLASSLLLPPNKNIGHGSNRTNLTMATSSVCGLEFINRDDKQDDSKYGRATDDVDFYKLCAFSAAAAAVSIMLAIVFIDRLSMFGISEGHAAVSTLRLVTDTFKQWKHPYQLLLIPLSLYNGMNKSFWSAAFTQAFVSCAVGVHYVGFVMVCYGVAAPIAIFVFSFFKKTKLRCVPYLFGFAAHLSVLITMFLWVPTATNLIILFVLSALWGIGSGIWYGMLYAFYSIVFKDNIEAAISNFQLWYCVGLTVDYAWNFGLNVEIKTMVMLIVLSLGVICYLIVEIHVNVIKSSKKLTPS